MSLTRSIEQLKAPSARMPRRRVEGDGLSLAPLMGTRAGREMGAPPGLHAIYQAQPVYIGISIRARMLRGLEWQVMWDDPDTPRAERGPVHSGHWAERLLARPNMDMVRSAFIELVSKWLDLNGNAFVYTPVQEGQLHPEQMFLLPSDRVGVVPGTDRLIAGYVFHSPGSGDVPIDAREMLHLKTLEPGVDTTATYLGQSILRSAFDAAKADRETQRYLARYMENDALPAFTITNEAPMTPDQFQEFRARWDATFKGSDKAGRWAMLQKGMRLDPIGETGRLSEFAQIAEGLLERVSAVLGIPAQILTWKDLNYATAEAMRAGVAESTIQPHAEYIGEEISRHFSQFERGLVIRPKAQTYRDPDQARADRTSYVGAGIMTINEVRQELGLDPVDGGDVPRVNGLPIDAAT